MLAPLIGVVLDVPPGLGGPASGWVGAVAAVGAFPERPPEAGLCFLVAFGGLPLDLADGADGVLAPGRFCR